MAFGDRIAYDRKIGYRTPEAAFPFKVSDEFRTLKSGMVPLAGIEPALLAELDFESSASTNSATGARENRHTGCERAGL